MRKSGSYLAVLLMLAASQALVAQHSGHSMGGMSGGSYGHDHSAMESMQKMMAVQASDEQKAQFHSLAENTRSLKEQIGALGQFSGSELSSHLDALKKVVETNSDAQRSFLRNLSQAQESGLKKQIQKLTKANDDMSKAVATAIRELGQGASQKQQPGKLDKLEKTVDKVMREQQGIASEMGIV